MYMYINVTKNLDHAMTLFKLALSFAAVGGKAWLSCSINTIDDNFTSCIK